MWTVNIMFQNVKFVIVSFKHGPNITLRDYLINDSAFWRDSKQNQKLYYSLGFYKSEEYSALVS